MLFRSVRGGPHEGLDMCLFRDEHGQIHGLGGNAKVPAMYAGRIANIEADFLGQSVFVGHDIVDERGSRLFTIYGHTVPIAGIATGKTLEEGEVFTAVTDNSKTDIAPHLHISIAWIPATIASEKPGWKKIGAPGAVAFIDPLEIMDCKYSVLKQENE